MSIFRAYDIRGIYGKDITPSIANSIGKAFGTFSSYEKISVARDNRLSSDILHDRLIKGVVSTGSTVIDLGVVPTPLLYFSIMTLNLDGGIMITASHNPSEFNGFKLNKSKLPFFPEEILQLKRIIDSNNFKKGMGKVSEKNIVPEYMNFHLKHFKIKKSLKIVIDAGNGTTGEIVPKLLNKLGCETYELYTELDGEFPNHFPNPAHVENLKDLQEKVSDVSADLGIAFDGDGDRVVFVDNEGRILQGDQSLAIMAKYLLQEFPNSRILMDVKCSNMIAEFINDLGGKSIFYRTGHSFIKSKLMNENIELAGELSGHFYFNSKYYGFDDGIHAAIRFISYLSKDEQSLADLLNLIPKNESSPEIDIKCSDEQKFNVIKLLQKTLSKEHEIIDIDGVRINFPNGWGLVRASNTEPKITLRFEGKNKKDLESITKIFMDPLNKILEDID
ncbi:MAG: phosphomannomutase/phosphoglucomutase [Candidatus Helarchaeota archaeon]